MLDGRFRFDNFVVGAANRLAVSAARAVAESPGAVYNPLFIYSSSGLGKTHLIGALGWHARAVHPDLAIEYVTLEDFVDQLHAAIALGQADGFKRRYQSVGILLLDDVQFLTGRPETQSEMLRIFNALQGSGRQIVMTCDRPPTEIADVDQRLLTRLSGGLIVDIGLPDYETRVAILRHKTSERGLSFSAGVLEEVARSAWSSVRELQGALNRMIAHQSISDTALSVDDVRAVLGTALPVHVVPADEFESFLSDVSVSVAQHVEGWRAHLGERIAVWSGEGFATAMLERALEDTLPPDLESLETAFAAAADRLRVLEGEAVRIDTRHAGLAVFRDPERLAEAEEFLVRVVVQSDPPPAPSGEYTLSALAEGGWNQLALRAANEVIALPGSGYNPLFIHGAPGAGKTHLAHAIGNALIERSEGASTVACVSGAQFVDELIAAIQDGAVERWRARYRAADALVIDDLQSVMGAERSQDELFHLFNALHERGRQIVFTADRPPALLSEFEARLRSRFEGGLVVELRAPEPAEVAAAGLAATPAGNAAIDATPRSRRHSLSTGEFMAILSEDTPPPNGFIDGFFHDPEKIIAEWPGVDGRVIEELR